MNLCNKCGKPLWNDGTSTCPEICKCPPEPTTIGNYGWICPVCGRGNAPTTHTCPCTPPPFTPVVTWCANYSEGGPPANG